MKRLLRLDAKKAKGRKDAADDRRSNGEDDGSCEDCEVDGDGLGTRKCELRVCRESMDGEEGESDAEDAACQGEEEDFGESALQEARG